MLCKILEYLSLVRKFLCFIIALLILFWIPTFCVSFSRIFSLSFTLVLFFLFISMSFLKSFIFAFAFFKTPSKNVCSQLKNNLICCVTHFVVVVGYIGQNSQSYAMCFLERRSEQTPTSLIISRTRDVNFSVLFKPSFLLTISFKIKRINN